VVLDFTDHLSDYQLYCIVYRDILPSQEKQAPSSRLALKGTARSLRYQGWRSEPAASIDHTEHGEEPRAMGTIDFVKDAGRRVGLGESERDREAASAAANRDEGKVPNQAVKENTIIVIGNIRGVAKVDDRMEVEEPAPESTFYTVKSGDTLGAIAKEHCGTPRRT